MKYLVSYFILNFCCTFNLYCKHRTLCIGRYCMYYGNIFVAAYRMCSEKNPKKRSRRAEYNENRKEKGKFMDLKEK